MKKLYLLRHSYSNTTNITSDFLRPLNEAGLLLCNRIADFIYQNTIIPQQILCSPALRTKQTIELIEQRLNTKFNVSFLDELYQAKFLRLRSIIQSIENIFTNVMIVGHNPSITQIYNDFTKDKQFNFTPGHLACLKFSHDNWQNISSNTGNLETFFQDE